MTKHSFELIQDIAAQLNQIEGLATTQVPNHYLGLQDRLKAVIDALRSAMFPYHFGEPTAVGNLLSLRTHGLIQAFDQLNQALCCVIPEQEKAQQLAEAVIRDLPDIVRLLETDITAAYEGDPAARNLDEIILTYPAFTAISIYRIAHKLYQLQVPLLPRMMTEYAHALTGIDIHPGATIGSHFFIDHGTGVVIGETTTIGRHVKLYQHVTLGAKSFQVGDDGTLVKGIKRHPDLGDYVVVYAGATILGGNTKIGDHCVIGGNVWLTHSVAPGEMVLARSSEQ